MKTIQEHTMIARTKTSPAARGPAILLQLMLSLLLTLTACEEPIGNQGPQGPQGPQGLEGPQGPIGPAGEDGSMIYAGTGAPGDDIGSVGDYYLNGTTGELYGPKSANGWGGPIIVLKGEDGQDGTDGQDGQDGRDGQDGADGQDGEDGSQIHAGNGAPDASLGVEGDFYLDKDSYDLYGPKTSNGWGAPLNLKGANGNANVTRYIFPGHDYSSSAISTHDIDVTEAEMLESAWEIYLVDFANEFFDEPIYYHIPGWGLFGNTQYYAKHALNAAGFVEVQVEIKEGLGEFYDNIYIIRIEASNTVDNRKQKGSIIPDHLDVSNYEEVAEYYGFGGGQ